MRMMRVLARRLSSVACLLLAWLVASGHVGTNQVVFEGRAGGYPVRVLIEPPGVVPGQVPILVRVLEGEATRITVRAAQWNVGTKGAPPAEDAAKVPGDPGVWAHNLWIMTANTYSVYVAVEGPLGNGVLVVPLQTTATRTLGMTRGMLVLLVVLGALLIAGVLTIVGAATREAALPPGVVPSAAQRTRARRFMVASAGGVAVLLLGGAAWWNAEAAAYGRRLYRPLAITTAVRTLDVDRVLSIAIVDDAWRANRLGALLPDHGKLMHLFLVSDPDHGVLAHLHPLRVHPDSFVTRIPPLPAGRYVLFGDLLFESGTQRTLVDTIEVPVAPVIPSEGGAAAAMSSSVAALTDADDAWRAVRAVPLGTAAVLPTGGTLQLTTDATVLRAQHDLRLSVIMREADGTLSPTEPYLGMAGHAMVLRRDAQVFLHLHPMGTASMEAQAQLMRRERGDTVAPNAASRAATNEAAVAPRMTGMDHAATMSSASTTSLAFPFAFPTAGAYRVFVQVKRRGVVETAAFDVEVPDASAR